MKNNISLTVAVTTIVAVLSLTPASALAQNVGNCGWGSKLFDGQRGIAPQVLAVTTNGTSGNQTFAITSGTSGCTQNGVVRSSWKTAAFVGGNTTKLARDMSRGEGESLNTLAHLMNVSSSDQAHFKATLKENFNTIFASENTTTDKVLASLHEVVKSDAALSGYSQNV